MLQDLKPYQKMKAAEIMALPKEILYELARVKAANGNASPLAKKGADGTFSHE